MDDIINVKNISVSYGQNEVIKDVSFQIQKGDFVGMAGPNGGGKTTLIRAILGLVPVTAGEINLFGRPQKLFKDFSKIGYLPQKHSHINSLLPALVEEVVLLGLLSLKRFPKIIKPEDTKLVKEILKELEIFNLKAKPFSELSGGQQQRVLLARALVSSPEILIFDEPSTALDPNSRVRFFNLIQQLNKERGVTTILVTHDTDHICKHAGKILYVDHKIVYLGEAAGFCAFNKDLPCSHS